MPGSSFGLIGLSHQTAPVSIRECLCVGVSEEVRAHQMARESLHGFALLSTCNRVELYGESRNGTDVLPALRDLVGSVADFGSVEPYLYEHSGQRALMHLTRVASGLDSMVIGEAQISGQVAEALRRAESERLASPRLAMAFREALEASRLVRRETALGKRPVSVAGAAVDRMRREAGTLSGKHVAIVGLGEMGGLITKILSKESSTALTFVNRTVERAEAAAAGICASALALEDLTSAIDRADIVVSTTSAPHLVIHPADLQPRRKRPLLMVDLAVPRDVDPNVAGIPGVRLLDIDGLRSSVEESLAERRAEIPKAEALISTQLEGAVHRLRALEVEPLIAELRRNAESIRQQELQRTFASMPTLSTDAQAKVDRLSQALVNKLLHEPTRRLREEAMHNGNAASSSVVISKLFALGEASAAG